MEKRVISLIWLNGKPGHIRLPNGEIATWFLDGKPATDADILRLKGIGW